LRKIILIIWILNFIQLFSQSGGHNIDFTGSNDYIYVNDHTSMRFGTGSFSFELWLNPDSFSGPDQAECIRVLEKSDYPTNPWWVLDIFQDGSVEMEMSEGSNFGGTSVAFDSEGMINLNVWTFLSIVVDRDEQKVQYYFNGILDSEFDIPIDFDGNLDPVNPFYIGANWNDFNGSIEELRIWTTALTSEKIQQWMHKNVTSSHPDWSTLAAYWKFNEGSGYSTYDSSDNNNTGTLTNMNPSTQWHTSVVPVASSLTEDLFDLKAIWNNMISNQSSIQEITDSNISPSEYILFGHNNEPVVFQTVNVPQDIDYRLSRVWRIEKYGNPSGDIIFDCTGLDTRNENYRMLVDDDGNFSNAEIIEGSFNYPDYLVSNHDFLHSCYYTLATVQQISPPNSVITSVENDTVFISWDSVPGVTSYTVYSSIDPDADPVNWILEQSGISSTNWSEPVSGTKKFYYVKAVN